MSEVEIKKAITKYRRISALVLGVFLMFMIGANFLFGHSSEVGSPRDPTFIWLTVVIGLNIVLSLSLYSFEKILVEMVKTKKSGSV
jgi:hypothetical protein